MAEPARDGPACPSCHLEGVGTPVTFGGERLVDRWDGDERNANLFCPSCGHGWRGSEGDVQRAHDSWAAYCEAELAAHGEAHVPRHPPGYMALLRRKAKEARAAQVAMPWARGTHP